MRIAFDHQAFCRRPYTGIARYYTRLLAHLPNVADGALRLFAPVHVSALLAADPVGRAAGYYLPWHPRPARPLVRALSGMLARRAIARWRPDLVHETYYSPQPSAPPGVPVVLTVFDLIHELFPHQFPLYDRVRAAKRVALRRAACILCISATTRRDLLRYYDLPAERIGVVHLGVDETPLPGPAVKKPERRPFFLFVGERSGYKNFTALVNAFAASPWLKTECELRCLGGGPFTRTERRLLHRLGIAARVHHCSGGDALLSRLYTQALALVYPSCYEGFGLPLLEAMRHGCPVAASTGGALPEIGGDAAEWFDPTDPAAIRASLESLANSSARRAELQARGFARVRQFGWERCARATWAHYCRCVDTAGIIRDAV